jgi:hypothetical protein
MGPVAPEFMGFCSLVYVREVGSAKVTVFQQDSGDDTGIATVMLRGATSNMLQVGSITHVASVRQSSLAFATKHSLLYAFLPYITVPNTHSCMLSFRPYLTLQAIERAVDDGVNTIKALGKDGRLLAGAGACDIEVSRKLDDFGDKETGLSQYAIKQVSSSNNQHSFASLFITTCLCYQTSHSPFILSLFPSTRARSKSCLACSRRTRATTRTSRSHR